MQMKEKGCCGGGVKICPMAIVMVLITFVFIVVMAALYGVQGMVSSELDSKEVAVGTPDLDQINKMNEKLLNEYKWVDKDSGVVRIPIQRAKWMIIKEAQNRLSASNDELKDE